MSGPSITAAELCLQSSASARTLQDPPAKFLQTSPGFLGHPSICSKIPVKAPASHSSSSAESRSLGWRETVVRGGWGNLGRKNSLISARQGCRATTFPQNSALRVLRQHGRCRTPKKGYKPAQAAQQHPHLCCNKISLKALAVPFSPSAESRSLGWSETAVGGGVENIGN
jgi:hypothetical protein